MRQHIITSRAEAHLEDIYSYIASDNVAAAIRFLEAVRTTIDRLLEMPGIGRKWEAGLAGFEDVRVYPLPSPYRNYLVFYRVEEDRIVQVIGVLHGSRNLGTAFPDLR